MGTLSSLGLADGSDETDRGPETSGRALLGLLKHVKDEKGIETLSEIISRCDKARKIFAKRIWVTSWYPYRVYVDFLNAIDVVLGNGDKTYCRTLGREAGKRDIGTVFQVYLAFASAEKLIRSCSKIWAKYYRNAGRMEAVSWEKNNTTIRILDFPEMSETHCRLMEGWMASTLLAIGFNTTDLSEVRCTNRGDEYHEFHCTWSKLSWRS